MGEAKRRQESDPNYGKVPQKRPKKKRFSLNLDPKQVSPIEWVIWAVLFGTAAATFAGSYFWQ
ncbi:MAG: hypothetical protein AAF821_21705 [Cyanobacteria bacterium P01_D01_bin.156]